MAEASGRETAAGLLSRARLLVIAALLVGVAALLALAWRTRGAPAELPLAGQTQRAAGGLVDLRPWQTAHALAGVAVTAEERDFAAQAERTADHEIDQAFASALRLAGLERRALTGEALAISQHVEQLQQAIRDDKTLLQNLSEWAATSEKAAAQVAEDIDIAKTQMALDSAMLADAQQDLARAGGDEPGRIQAELAAHEAAIKEHDSGNPHPARRGAEAQPDALAGRLSAWLDQRSRLNAVRQAQRQAQADRAALARQHEQLAARVKASSANGGADKSASLAGLKRLSVLGQTMGILNDRMQSQRQLETVYANWSTYLEQQRRLMLHLLLRSLALITFILACVIFLDALARHLLSRPKLDRGRVKTLHIIFKLGIQLVGALLILFVIFGAPNQTPTIVGLTTAGLTLVLQDFILAFFGWFVLMGRHGIRIGDWVEINGVSGEVTEISLFRTTILETGNWTDQGHPTGRRVSFVNSFAIKGQYFNFSTAGQWMWDEIRFSVPAGEETYRLLEPIHQVALRETQAAARLAEAEWKRGSRSSGLNQFAADPAVEMRPAASGVNIVVRYVTRAAERFEVRNRLSEGVLGLLNKPATPPAA